MVVHSFALKFFAFRISLAHSNCYLYYCYITLIAYSKEELEFMGDRITTASAHQGLEINRTKTKSMTVHGNGMNKMDGEEIMKAEKFKFLGSYITPEGDSSTEINARLGMAKSVALSLVETWRSNELSIDTKVNIAKALVWSLALYGCESWTIRKKEEKTLYSFEMWLWRRVLLTTLFQVQK